MSDCTNPVAKLRYCVCAVFRGSWSTGIDQSCLVLSWIPYCSQREIEGFAFGDFFPRLIEDSNKVSYNCVNLRADLALITQNAHDLGIQISFGLAKVHSTDDNAKKWRYVRASVSSLIWQVFGQYGNFMYMAKCNAFVELEGVVEKLQREKAELKQQLQQKDSTIQQKDSEIVGLKLNIATLKGEQKGANKAWKEIASTTNKRQRSIQAEHRE